MTARDLLRDDPYAATERRNQLRNDWETGELDYTFLMKPVCDRCTESFEPSQLTLYRIGSTCRSVCVPCMWAMRAEEREGYDEVPRRHWFGAGT